MGAFSCPHFQPEGDACTLLQTDCVPGRPGCVLAKNSVFAIPIEERIRRKQEDREDDEQKAEK